MLNNYLKIALRNLLRYKSYSWINIVGLAVGMACCILILLYVRHELSFDRFHENSDRIYRVLADWTNQEALSARTPGQLALAAKAQIPEVLNAVRVAQGPKSAFKYGEKAFYEGRHFLVDAALFEMFDFELMQGDPETALDDAQSVVLTEAAATKYFGDQDPMGKSLTWNNWRDYKVTGILEKIPDNSSLQFEFLESHQLTEKYWRNGYTWRNFQHETYVQLRDGAKPDAVGKKITELLFSNVPEIRPHLTKLQLQPLSALHLDANIARSTALVTDAKNIYVFSVIAVLVLLIACTNFMNLSTARSLLRTKEVGVRKVAGARRTHLMNQFLGESLVFAGLALVIALLLVETAMPVFNQLSEKQLALDYSNLKLWLALLAIFLTTGVVAGFYPAIFLSSFKPVTVLKGAHFLATSRTSKNRGGLRSALVVAQFTFSIALIIAATIIYAQLDYMQNKSLGFTKHNLLYVPAKGEARNKYETLKNELQRHPNVIGVTAKESLPMVTLNEINVTWPGKTSSRRVAMEITGVDYNFFELVEMEFAAGRNFSRNKPSDAQNAIIVNEEAVNVMELESPVGKRITVAGTSQDAVIIGVVKNAHFKSLHHRIEPQIFYVLTERELSSENMDLFGIILVKMRSEGLSETISRIRQVWTRLNPDAPFEYHFLDETIDRQYHSEKRISTIVAYFSFLAIFIACIGLFGLAAFASEQRKKEVGVRKVLGASVLNIMALISGDFLKLVIAANIIAWPVAWFAMNQWLQEFAYRIDLQWWPFALAGILAVAIALLTVSFQAVKAAVFNPVESLRYE